MTNNKQYPVKTTKIKQEFDSGAIRSDRVGKGRFDLISPIGLRRLAVVYEKGGINHGDRNWEKGFSMSRALDSAERHINQYKEGLRDEDHLAHVVWNLFSVMHFEETIARGITDSKYNDLPNYLKNLDYAKNAPEDK